jgi:hypothetical protein
MFAEVIIVSDRTADVIALPSGSVLIKSGKTVVATIEGGNKIVFKESLRVWKTGRLWKSKAESKPATP